MEKNKVRSYYALVQAAFRPESPVCVVDAIHPCRVAWFGKQWNEVSDIIGGAARLNKENKVEDVIELLTKLGVEWED